MAIARLLIRLLVTLVAVTLTIASSIDNNLLTIRRVATTTNRRESQKSSDDNNYNNVAADLTHQLLSFVDGIVVTGPLGLTLKGKGVPFLYLIQQHTQQQKKAEGNNDNGMALGEEEQRKVLSFVADLASNPSLPSFAQSLLQTITSSLFAVKSAVNEFQPSNPLSGYSTREALDQLETLGLDKFCEVDDAKDDDDHCDGGDSSSAPPRLRLTRAADEQYVSVNGRHVKLLHPRDAQRQQHQKNGKNKSSSTPSLLDSAIAFDFAMVSTTITYQINHANEQDAALSYYSFSAYIMYHCLSPNHNGNLLRVTVKESSSTSKITTTTNFIDTASDALQATCGVPTLVELAAIPMTLASASSLSRTFHVTLLKETEPNWMVPTFTDQWHSNPIYVMGYTATAATPSSSSSSSSSGENAKQNLIPVKRRAPQEKEEENGSHHRRTIEFVGASLICGAWSNCVGFPLDAPHKHSLVTEGYSGLLCDRLGRKKNSKNNGADDTIVDIRCSAISWSGKGAASSPVGLLTVPHIYNRSLGSDKTTEFMGAAAFPLTATTDATLVPTTTTTVMKHSALSSAAAPDIVLINLGNNDFAFPPPLRKLKGKVFGLNKVERYDYDPSSSSSSPSGDPSTQFIADDDFIGRYVHRMASFVHTIVATHHKNPLIPVVLQCGPMSSLYCGYLPETIRLLKAGKKQMKKNGNGGDNSNNTNDLVSIPNVFIYEFSNADKRILNSTTSCWAHPSLAGSVQMADELEVFVRKLMNW